MALQMGALREALIDVGASPEKAAKAAEEVISYERIKSDVRLLTWMVGGVYPLLIGILVKLLSV